MESDEQIAVVQFCKYKSIPIFAIPNGGSRNKIEAANMKRQGVKAGIPDLCVPAAKGGYFGLYIEMKFGRNKTSPAQDDWIKLLNDNGYLAKTCWGAQEAIDLLLWYFSQPNTPCGK